MARRGRICVVHGDRDRIDLATLDCREHRHEKLADAEELIATGRAEWVKQPTSLKEKAIVRVLKQAARHRGLSCKVGEALAMGLEDNQPWARLMRSEQGRKIYRRKKIQVGGESAGVATRSVFVHLSPPKQFQAVGGT